MGLRGLKRLASRTWIRVGLQALVSLALIAILVRAAGQADVASSFRAIQPGILVLAAGLQLVAFLINSRRWQILLRHAGIRERLARLTVLYWIGQFFSLFLPTSAGGDAVRVYEVARRSGRPTLTFVATLQERLLGLSSALLLGLVATSFYWHLLPGQLRLGSVVVQTLGMIAIGVLLYPRILFAVASSFKARWGKILPRRPLPARLLAALRHVKALPPLPAHRLLALITMAVAAALLGTAMYFVVGRSLGIEAGFLAFCLAVPLVWIVRMLPISLNGVGVGEGALVFLLSLFAVPQDKALALALAMLGLQSGLALLGGLLLVTRPLHGAWSGARTSSRQAPDASPLPFPESDRPVRHAA